MYPFRGDCFAVENGWYVASFAKDLTHSLQAKWILKKPVALYRDSTGRPIALHGLCPHRHFPLGESQLRSDEVVCGYHGIRFDGHGTCTHIPGQQDIPESFNIRTYPVVEHGMWIWIWMGDPDKADPSLLPDLEEIGYCGDSMIARPFYALEVQGRYQLLNDNLFDLSHLAYLHGTSIGTTDYADTIEELTEGPGYIRSTRRVLNSAPPPTFDFEAETIDRISGMNFYYPGLHAGFDESLLPEGHPEAGKVLRKSRVFHAVTPSTEDTCYYWFGMAQPHGEGLDEAFVYLKPVVEEDVFATAEIEKALQRSGGRIQDHSKMSDRNETRGRRLLQRLMDEEAAAKRDEDDAQPLTVR